MALFSLFIFLVTLEIRPTTQSCAIASLNAGQYILNDGFEGPALGSTETFRVVTPGDASGWTSTKS